MTWLRVRAYGDEEWVPIPAPPKQKSTAHNHFQILLTSVVAVFVLGLLIESMAS